MEYFNSKIKISLVALSLLVGMILVLPVLAEEEDRPTDPNVVRGQITLLGRDYVQVDTTRYILSSNIQYVNEEGRAIKHGRKKMKKRMKVDLLMKEGSVVQVMIYGLLRR